MGERAYLNRIKKIMELQAEVKEIQQEIESIQDELKLDMIQKDVDEIEAGDFTVRYKLIKSSRLDSKELKKELPDVFAKFTKETESKRFTIS